MMYNTQAGQIVLMQKEQPSFLYIIIKGMCKVFKRPNQSEVIERMLIEMRAKTAKFDFKYIYHHGLRKQLSKGDVHHLIYRNNNHSDNSTDNHTHGRSHSPINSSSSNNLLATGSSPSSSILTSKSNMMKSPSFRGGLPSSPSSKDVNNTFSIPEEVNILSLSNVTLPEEKRVELELEIRRLESLLAKVI